MEREGTCNGAYTWEPFEEAVHDVGAVWVLDELQSLSNEDHMDP